MIFIADHNPLVLYQEQLLRAIQSQHKSNGEVARGNVQLLLCKVSHNEDTPSNQTASLPFNVTTPVNETFDETIPL